ncbi:MmgE/PrpD family protein, partial [Chloroflexota bacterium]
MVEDKIAEFITGTEFERIPTEAIKITKRAILDCIGVTLAAYQEPAGKIITQYVKEAGSRAEAGV